jgi:hypothetical protein
MKVQDVMLQAKPMEDMVGTRRLELLTSTVSILSYHTYNPLAPLLFQF